jgi:hypothetical protein
MLTKTLLAVALIAATTAPVLAGPKNPVPWDKLDTPQKRFDRVASHLSGQCKAVLSKEPDSLVEKIKRAAAPTYIMRVDEATAVAQAKARCPSIDAVLRARH